jgi:hypothetical protein
MYCKRFSQSSYKFTKIGIPSYPHKKTEGMSLAEAHKRIRSVVLLWVIFSGCVVESAETDEDAY